MKYFIILTISLVCLIGTIAMAYFLWDAEQDWKWKAFMLAGPCFCGYLAFRNIQNYSKIQLKNSELTVSKILFTQKYELNKLISWSEETNLYRVKYRRLKLEFVNTSFTLMDYADPKSIEHLYHYLRTHYENIRIYP